MPPDLLTGATNQVKWKSPSEAATKLPTPVVIVQGDKAVTFNVNADGGGNPFSGKSHEQQKQDLANLLFPGNQKAVQLLEQLSENLAEAKIESADIAVVDGKVQITNLKEKENPFPFSALDKFMGNRISRQGDARQSEVTAKLIMSIMSMASEAKSDLIKMIIKSMEENHLMWMAMLKELASSDAKKKMDAKALLVKLMSTMVSGDPDAAKAISSLLSLLGITVVIDNKEINTPMSDEEFNKIKAQYASKATSSINNNNFAERYIRGSVKVIQLS